MNNIYLPINAKRKELLIGRDNIERTLTSFESSLWRFIVDAGPIVSQNKSDEYFNKYPAQVCGTHTVPFKQEWIVNKLFMFIISISPYKHRAISGSHHSLFSLTLNDLTISTHP